MQNQEIIKALKNRYAVKIFNPNQKLEPSLLQTILDGAILSPSSLGLEPWHFIVIEDKEIRKQIYEYSKQPKVLDAPYLIVITYKNNIDKIITERLERTAKIQNQKIEDLKKYEEFLHKEVAGKTENELQAWLKAQTYIPLGVMTLTASLLGVDNCAMEGFDNNKVDEILKLKEKNLSSVTMLALGYRGEDPHSLKPKIRREKEDAVSFV